MSNLKLLYEIGRLHGAIERLGDTAVYGNPLKIQKFLDEISDRLRRVREANREGQPEHLPNYEKIYLLAKKLIKAADPDTIEPEEREQLKKWLETLPESHDDDDSFDPEPVI